MKFYGWSDNISGIAIYHIEVYLMLTDSRKPGELVESLVSDVMDVTANNYIYHCRGPGVYSIRVSHILAMIVSKKLGGGRGGVL